MDESTSIPSSSSSSSMSFDLSGSLMTGVLAKFHRKELVIGDVLPCSNDSCKYFAIDSVHLRTNSKKQIQQEQDDDDDDDDHHHHHPFRQEIQQYPHLYAAILVSDSNVNAAQLWTDLPNHHDHVLGVYGVYSTKLNIMLIVDRIMCTMAECLEHWSSRNNAPPPLLLERLYVAHNTASALSFLHSNNVGLGGDVCAANIGFDMRGHLKLMNFTSARPLDCTNSKSIEPTLGTTTTTTTATPQQVGCHDLSNHAPDVFSFTIFVWELLMLVPAQTNMSQDYYIAVMNDSNWPLWTKDMINHGLCADVRKRTNMRDILRCLQLVLQEEEEKEQFRKKVAVQRQLYEDHCVTRI